MSIAVEVGLLSGQATTVRASSEENVETLRFRAEAALGVRRGRLVDSCGSMLDEHVLIKDSSLQNGDSLTLLHISSVRACGASNAFAAILGDGSVVTWGVGATGGDSSSVQNHLKNVQQDSSQQVRLCCHSRRRICGDLGCC